MSLQNQLKKKISQSKLDLEGHLIKFVGERPVELISKTRDKRHL